MFVSTYNPRAQRTLRNIQLNSLAGHMYVCVHTHLVAGAKGEVVVMDDCLGKLNRKGNKQFYSFILIILWILIIISVAYDWVNNRGAFVLNNDSPLGIVIALRDDAPILARITGILNILVSDAILVRLISMYFVEMAYGPVDMALQYPLG